LRWVIELVFILLIFSLISSYNETFAHSAVELFAIVVAWLVFLLIRTQSQHVQKTLFFPVGIAYAYSALNYFIIMMMHNNTLPGGVESDTFNSQLELSGRVFESMTIFLALLSFKYFHKITYLLVCLTILFVISFTVLVDKFFPWCSMCLVMFSKVNLLISLAAFLIANLFLVKRISPGSYNLPVILLSISLLINMASEIVSIVVTFDLTGMRLGDLLRLIAMYILYKAFLTEWKAENAVATSGNVLTENQEKKVGVGYPEVDKKLENSNSVLTYLLVEHDMPHLIDKIIDQMITLVHADGGEIGIFDPKRNTVRIVASKNSTSQTGALIPVGVGVIGTTISRKEPVIVEKGMFVEGKEKERSQGCICVPLISQSVLIGAIMVSRTDHNKSFTKEDLNSLKSFSQSAAIALSNTQLLEDAQKRAETDSLTGLANHRHFFDLASNEFTRAIRYHHSLTALMFDIDHFKEVNDTYGHSLGDKVLVSIANLCTQIFRSIDIVGRYGGEEFAVLLPETPVNTASEVAERLRRSVAAMIISHEKTNISVTISTGISSLRTGNTSVNGLIAQADEALYSAKNAGRNKIVIWNNHIHTMFVRKQKKITFQRKLKSHPRNTKNSHI
jgi:diguanylate cyclase (GGDEF)-like protein